MIACVICLRFLDHLLAWRKYVASTLQVICMLYQTLSATLRLTRLRHYVIQLKVQLKTRGYKL